MSLLPHCQGKSDWNKGCNIMEVYFAGNSSSFELVGLSAGNLGCRNFCDPMCIARFLISGYRGLA